MKKAKCLTEKEGLLKRLEVALDDPNMRAIVSLLVDTRENCDTLLNRQQLSSLLKTLTGVTRSYTKNVLGNERNDESILDMMTLSPAHVRILKFAAENETFRSSDCRERLDRTYRLYTHLGELHEMGLISWEEEKVKTRGRPPHIYKLTEAGQKAFEYLNATEDVQGLTRSVKVPRLITGSDQILEKL